MTCGLTCGCGSWQVVHAEAGLVMGARVPDTGQWAAMTLQADVLPGLGRQALVGIMARGAAEPGPGGDLVRAGEFLQPVRVAVAKKQESRDAAIGCGRLASVSFPSLSPSIVFGPTEGWAS